MADGVTITAAANATPPAGTVVSTDDAGASGHVQRVKLAYSADGSAVHVPADADGLLVNLGANNDVSVASLPLPTGAATSALQTQPGVDIGDVTVNNAAGAAAVNVQDGGNSLTVDGTVAATQSGTWTVQPGNTPNTSPWLASIHDGTTLATVRNLAANDALNVAIVDGAGAQITSFGGGTEYTEDAASAADPVGGQVMARRRDALAVETTTDGDVTALNATGKGELYVKQVDAVPVTDNAGSLTVDGTVAVSSLPALVAGSANIGDVDVLTVPAPLSTTGGGTEATALRVTVANDSTGVLSVDDNGGALTVDGTVTANAGTGFPPVVTDGAAAGTTGIHVLATDGTNAQIIKTDTAGELQVDVLTLPALVAGSANIGDVDVLTVPAPLSTTGGGTEATALRVTVANDSTGVLSIDDNGGAITVDGTVTANQGTANATPWEVAGDVASDVAITANPLTIGGRASTAVPTAVSADGDAVNLWANRSGAQMVSTAPHIGLNSDPWNLVHEAAQYTTTQTSTVLVAGGASEKIVVTKVQIQVGGTTAGTLQLYFGTGAFSRGTSRAIFDGEFAPSSTLKPGVVMDGPFISGTNGDDLMVTDSAAINPLTINVWYYLVT